MDLRQHLPARFASANLSLVVAEAPLARRGPNEIVQMDIARARKNEHFRIFPGASTNRIEVTTVDRSERQLVLLVHEPRRKFTTTISASAPRDPRVRVIFEDRFRRIIELQTSESKRHFLCGMDEQHLFIARLPRAASTVSDAHRALRALEVPPSLRLHKERVRRQGEWFFLPITADEERMLDAVAVQQNTGIAHAANIPRAGRQHFADEIAVTKHGVFVRGRVRHPDHRTLDVRGWHRVVPNRESVEQPIGVLWVD